MSRFLFVVLDGVGIGEMPDAVAYGDRGSHTLGNISLYADLHLPNLQRLGLGNIASLRGVPPSPRPLALAGRLATESAGKDTTSGHWEHMGLVTDLSPPTYPEGFPDEIISLFADRIGRGVLGNNPASGTEIIAELGAEHLKTGKPIVYTSADSVFQIAAHTDVIPLETLYEYCQIARDLLTGPHAVTRVIARPFTGPLGAFVRTPDRRDFALEPLQSTYLDLLVDRDIPVIGVGKISQIFAGRGVAVEKKVAGNGENLAALGPLFREMGEGLLFTNLVDFDTVWGHRNDLDGFVVGLEALDRTLPALIDLLGPGDRLLLTADHGVDPTTVSTDHSREYVPLLYFPSPDWAPAACYESFLSDTGATVFSRLTGEVPPLKGRPLEDLKPARGWRGYPVRPALAGRGSGAGAEPRSSARDATVVARPREPGPCEIREAAEFLGERWGPAPKTAVVLGSGLGGVLQHLGRPDSVPYGDIPHWPAVSVSGHEGRLSVGMRAGVDVALLSGRAHWYEDLSPGEIQLPLRSLARWGIRRVVLTNAAGSLAETPASGEIALVDSVMDFQQVAAGARPARLRATTKSTLEALEFDEDFRRLGIPILTYAAMPGPQYETAAEVDFLRWMGADLVGMSVVAELHAAHAAGLKVAVVSVVTNAAAENHAASGGHEQVLRIAGESVPRILAVTDALLRIWA